MATQITAQELKEYRRTAWLRWQADRQRRNLRREQAWHLAYQAADLLKRDFGVTRIVVFGSLTRQDRFTQWSDVDLAAWGLSSQNWLKAIGAVNSLSDEIELNLVDVECCSPELLASIEREGVLL